MIHRQSPWLLALAGVALVTVSALWISGPDSTDDTPGPAGGPHGLLVLAAPEPAAPPPTIIDHTTLSRGDNVVAALGRLGLETGPREELLAVLREEIDLRKLPARSGLATARDEAGKLLGISVRSEDRRMLRATPPEADSGSWVTEWVTLPVETEIVEGGGVIERSVAQAFSSLPLGTALTLAFADVFQWDVDLLIDPRPGDTIRVVYELQRLGAVPADLPPFGNTASKRGDLLGLGKLLAAVYDGSEADSIAFWVEEDDGAGSYYDTDGNPLRKSFLKSPLNYRRISSRFTSARRHPITRKVSPHHGVDFAASAGTPVVATADGRVVSSGWSGPLGRAVRIRHGSEYVTVYGHLQSTARGIRAGAEVRQNQVIGFVGSTGRATGPHLHYTMIRSGQPINPLAFENPAVDPLPEALRPRLETAMDEFLARLESHGPA